jgi:predicted metal-binding membrane protein
VPASLPRQRPFFRFGMFCVGSSVGLMLVLVALEPMSVIWVAVVGGIVLAHKLLPPRAAIDVPLALGIVGSESQLSSDDGKERSR